MKPRHGLRAGSLRVGADSRDDIDDIVHEAKIEGRFSPLRSVFYHMKETGIIC